jgi:NADH:ubiquinone oxidoreductase subunit F (NADH-binding)
MSPRCSTPVSRLAARTRCRSGLSRRHSVPEEPGAPDQYARIGITDPLNLDDYTAHGGYEGLTNALAMSGADIVKDVTDSGLRGRGGAAFPTGIKWNTVLGATADRKYIVCNADEGDSGTFSDRMIMEGDPYCLIEGMTIAGIAVGATQGYIYLRSEYPHAFATLKEAIRRARAAGWLGDDVRDSGKAFELEVRWALAPTSAAKKLRCWKAWKASAASCASSRRCRRSKACSASRPSSTT